MDSTPPDSPSPTEPRSRSIPWFSWVVSAVTIGVVVAFIYLSRSEFAIVYHRGVPAPMPAQVPYRFEGYLLRNWGAEGLEIRGNRVVHFVILEGIRTPDSVQWDRQFKSRFRKLLHRKKVVVEVAVQDVYHREVGKAFVDDQNLNLKVLELGLARFNGDRIPDAADYRNAEAKARQARLGIWSPDYEGSVE